MWDTIVARLIEAVDSPTQAFAFVFAVAVCSYAGLCGGRPERIAGAAFFAGQMASVFSQDLSDWVGPQLGVFAVDLVMLAFLVGLVLRTGRTWAMFAAGFHLLGTLTHVALAIDPRLHTFAYWIVINLLSYFVFLSLVAGTTDALLRRRRAARTA